MIFELESKCYCVPVGAFNQEKALVGAFSVIVQLHRLIVYGSNPDDAVVLRAEAGVPVHRGEVEPE